MNVIAKGIKCMIIALDGLLLAHPRGTLVPDIALKLVNYRLTARAVHAYLLLRQELRYFAYAIVDAVIRILDAESAALAFKLEARSRWVDDDEIGILLAEHPF